MSEGAVIDLIFMPGFSTAADVTDLSGRGVGMDAVRASIEHLGGRVQLETRIGAGSTVRFVLPFSVMMTRVMTVEAGGQWYGIPLDAVIETIRVRRDEIRSVSQAHAFVLRNRTVPLIGLAATLGWARAESSSDATVVVASSGGVLGGLEVDRLGARMDVMLKPAEGLLSGIPAIAERPCSATAGCCSFSTSRRCYADCLLNGLSNFALAVWLRFHGFQNSRGRRQQAGAHGGRQGIGGALPGLDPCRCGQRRRGACGAGGAKARSCRAGLQHAGARRPGSSGAASPDAPGDARRGDFRKPSTRDHRPSKRGRAPSSFPNRSQNRR